MWKNVIKSLLMWYDLMRYVAKANNIRGPGQYLLRRASAAEILWNILLIYVEAIIHSSVTFGSVTFGSVALSSVTLSPVTLGSVSAEGHQNCSLHLLNLLWSKKWIDW